jgi:hypothetical protein
MADVRLTAVNPENSEVYPVACNDKGELILNGASRLEVAEFLDVASTTYADNTGLYLGTSPGNINFREIRLNKDGSAQFSQVVQVGGFVSYVRTDAADQNLASFNSNVGGLNVPQIRFTASGGASFSGDVDFGPYSESNTGLEGAVVRSSGYTVINRTSDVAALQIRQSGILNITLNAGGSAIFAGKVDFYESVDLGGGYISPDGGISLYESGGIIASKPASANPSTDYVWQGYLSGSGVTSQINANGTAVFNGNVTAPNITFKLAPATVAAMPAPLIDEGFAVNEELDLLSELMKMKLQIRDLNAFMQRTLQDGSETTQ